VETKLKRGEKKKKKKKKGREKYKKPKKKKSFCYIMFEIFAKKLFFFFSFCRFIHFREREKGKS
jgi:hypothetical protein